MPDRDRVIGRLACDPDRFPGRWRVAEMAANHEAQRFWRQIIDEYTNGDFDEVEE